MNLNIPDSNSITPGMSQLHSYFCNRKIQMRLWRIHPPHWLGIFILLSVSFEFNLAKRLAHDMGFSFRIVGETLATGIFLVLLELMVASSAERAAQLFQKKGLLKTTITFFNINLIPFLLFLPLTVILRTAQAPPFIRLLVLVILLLKTLQLWKESMEINYSLLQWQSALVMAGVAFLFYLFFPLILGLGFLGAIQDAMAILQ